MKYQDFFMEAHKSVIKINGLRKTIDLVQKGTYALTIGGVYQAAPLLEAIKESILKELRKEITEEETALLKMGIVIEDETGS